MFFNQTGLKFQNKLEKNKKSLSRTFTKNVMNLEIQSSDQ